MKTLVIKNKKTGLSKSIAIIDYSVSDLESIYDFYESINYEVYIEN